MKFNRSVSFLLPVLLLAVLLADRLDDLPVGGHNRRQSRAGSSSGSPMSREPPTADQSQLMLTLNDFQLRTSPKALQLAGRALELLMAASRSTSLSSE